MQLSETIIELRKKTCQIVNLLLRDGKARHEKEAIEIVTRRSVRNKAKSGFSEDPRRAYGQYRKFKMSYKVQIFL